MAKSENKTGPDPDADVEAFLDQVEPARRREDAYAVMQMMREETGEEPVLWGGSMIGFGQYHYRYASGREGDWFLTGFAPRKSSLSLYVMSGFPRYEDLMKKLGKYKTGKACLYVNKLADVDEKVLRRLIRDSARHVAKHQGAC